MDPNSGRFLDEDDERIESWMERIAVGETVKIKGEELEVTRIGEREITLKLLSARDRTPKGLATFVETEDAAGKEILRHRENMLKRQK